jgi:1-acyl-sn-glycerol-3-phosphate acyltransferase
MLRTITTALVAIVATLIVAPTVTVIGIFRSNAPSIDRLIRRWARAIMRGAGQQVRVTGTANVDPEKRYIFVANHSSYLDIPVLLMTIPQPLRFMAKASLFKIPIFGTGLKATGFIPIDRKNRSKAKESLDLAAERIRKGNSIIIFPEEHRSHTREMQPFQRGAFLLALRAGLPLVPVAINGTFVAFPPGRLRVQSGRIHVVIGQPIDTSTISVRKKDQLMESVRSEITSMREAP